MTNKALADGEIDDEDDDDDDDQNNELHFEVLEPHLPT
jgi:hypothetical protein